MSIDGGKSLGRYALLVELRRGSNGERPRGLWEIGERRKGKRKKERKEATSHTRSRERERERGLKSDIWVQKARKKKKREEEKKLGIRATCQSWIGLFRIENPIIAI